MFLCFWNIKTLFEYFGPKKDIYIYILGPYRIIITILADLLNKQNGVDIGNCRYSCGSLWFYLIIIIWICRLSGLFMWLP